MLRFFPNKKGIFFCFFNCSARTRVLIRMKTLIAIFIFICIFLILINHGNQKFSFISQYDFISLNSDFPFAIYTVFTNNTFLNFCPIRI